MNPLQTRRQHLAMLAGVTAGALLPLPMLGGQAQAAGSASVFVPVKPARLADSRTGFGLSRPRGGSTVHLRVAGRSEAAIPKNATAAALNVVAVQPKGHGYLTLWPRGQSRPTASSLNFVPNVNRANLATSRIGSNGDVSIYAHASADIVVDIVGYYVAAPSTSVSAGRTVSGLSGRAYDSRKVGRPLAGGNKVVVDLADHIPAHASAAVLSVVAVRPEGYGYMSALPMSERGAGRPGTSSLNYTPGSIVANGAVVPIQGGDRRAIVYSHARSHVVVDVFGYITGEESPRSSEGLFVPLRTPYRMLDTRGSNNPMGSTIRLWPGWTVEVPILGRGGIPTSGASALVGNLTIVKADAGTYAAAYPAGTSKPPTSSGNALAGQTAATHLVSGITSRGLNVYGHGGSHMVLDATGYLTGRTPRVSSSSVRNPPAPVPDWPMDLYVPALGIRSGVQGSLADKVLDSGQIGWHPGTAYPNKDGAMYVFAHRTSAGGIFRHINRLKYGDKIYLNGSRRHAIYEVRTQRVVHHSQMNAIFSGAGNEPDGIVLVACSRPDGSPTNVDYRILVTARLVSITND